MRSKVIIVSWILIFLISRKSSVYAESNEVEFDENMFINYGSVMLIIDTDTGEIQKANNAAITYYGYEKDTLLKMKISDINILSNAEIDTEMQSALQQHRNYFNFKHRLSDGRIRHVEVYSYPYIDKKGKNMLFSIIHDVTDKVIAERQANVRKYIIFIAFSVGLAIAIGIAIYINKIRAKVNNNNKELQSLFDNMSEGFAHFELVFDDIGRPINFNILRFNKSFGDISEMKESELMGKNFSELIDLLKVDAFNLCIDVAVMGKNKEIMQYFKELKKYLEIKIYSPNKNQFVTIVNDVTQKTIAERRLVIERELFKTTLHSLGDGVISTDMYGRIEIMNAVAEHLTGWSIEEAKLKKFEDVFKIINEQTREIIPSPLVKVLETGDIIELANHTLLINKSGKEIPIEDSAAPIKDEKGNINGVVLVFRDFTEKKEKNSQILYLSYHDQLTGLYNRRFFEEELKRLDTQRNMPLSVAMVDVNGLKLTNDAFGHLMGDELLKRISNVLKQEFRADDIIARTGGDEFVILLPNADAEITASIVKRVYKAVLRERLEPIIISASIGFATKERYNTDLQEILKKAEENMYKKKITESQEMRRSTVESIFKILEKRLKAEVDHATKVIQYSMLIGRKLNLSDATLRDLEVAAKLHDIGKISISEHVIAKKSNLTPAEYEVLKRHSESGYQILKTIDDYSAIAEYILFHHERWDGKGYPKKIAGERIPLISRIITLTEAFDRMVSLTSYKVACSMTEAFQELEKNSGTQFDPELVKIFIELKSQIEEIQKEVE